MKKPRLHLKPVNAKVSMSCLIVALSLASLDVRAAQCPGTPTMVTGTVYCDNQFTLWVNGKEIVKDPVSFTPHQAVNVAFEWDGKSSLSYAIQCEDYASESGFEYIESRRAQLGDGALIAAFKDGMDTKTSSDWRAYTVTYGPTQASYDAGCSSGNLDKCVVEDRGMPAGWTASDFDDSEWVSATTYTARQAGWGRNPSWSEDSGCCTLTSPLDGSSIGCDADVPEKMCLSPRDEFSGSDAEFIWAADLEHDNRVLFRYTASCES